MDVAVSNQGIELISEPELSIYLAQSLHGLSTLASHYENTTTTGRCSAMTPSPRALEGWKLSALSQFESWLCYPEQSSKYNKGFFRSFY